MKPKAAAAACKLPLLIAITIGAALGGLLFDLTGTVGLYISSSVITLIAALVAMFAFQKFPNQVPGI
jgi:predicted MFS family arabinose efflux permease